MADSLLNALTEDTAPATNDWLYLVKNAAASGDDRKVKVGTVWTNQPTITARAYRGTNQAIANNTSTALQLTAETFDTTTLHDNATNNTRLTIPSGYGGKWLLTGCISYAGSATGVRYATFRLNGVTEFCSVGYGNNGADTVSCPILDVAVLAAGDYVELMAYQTSGGSLDVRGVAKETFFTAAFLGA